MKGGPNTRRWDGATALVAWFAMCISVLSFLYYFRQSEVLLYGDAVAHINIARRVFDSLTPGWLQLGTVWLPLPHLLMVPFLLSDWAWQTGIGGSLPSMIAFVLGAVGVFRLLRGTVRPSSSDILTRVVPWLGALIYAANPNLIYLQTTAMTEPLYLAFFVWSVVHLNEFAQACGKVKPDAIADSSSLTKCGLCLMGACLTRYDGWFLAAIVCVAAGIAVLRSRHDNRQLRRGLVILVLLAATAPIFWLAYNAAIYRNPLEFANGPYSAKAIEQKTSVAGAPLHPGAEHIGVAASYFLKSAELNLGEKIWGRMWIVLLLTGTLLASLLRPYTTPLLLLWAPLPFYAFSIAYGSVPVFLPVWWPFSFYNTRYGVELLPAFAVFAPLGIYLVATLTGNFKIRVAITAALVLFVGGSYTSIWRNPVCFREAWINSRTRLAIEGEVAAYLRALPPDSTLLMYLGDHVGALQQAGVPLRRVINEGNHRVWKQPSDPEGLWERALANPAQFADFVVTFENDPVSSVPKDQLTTLAVIRATGQPQATIYQAHRQH